MEDLQRTSILRAPSGGFRDLLVQRDDIERGHRPREALQSAFSQRVEACAVAEARNESFRYHDLSIPRLGAKPRGEIADRADRGVFPSSLVAHCADRRVAGCDTDAEADVEAVASPFLQMRPHRIAKRHGKLDGAHR